MKIMFTLFLALTSISFAQDYWEVIGTFTDASVTAISFAHNGDIFVGTGFEGSSFSDGGIYRSTDNGEHWTKTNYSDRNVAGIAICSNDYIFVGTNTNGVFRTTDYGETWTEVNDGLTIPYINCMARSSNDYIFAGTDEGGVFRTTDYGDNWWHNGNTIIWSLTINSNDHIFCGTDFNGIYRSTDYGLNWAQVSYIDYTNVWALASYSNNVFAGTQKGLFRSTNNGGTWEYPSVLDKDTGCLAINSIGHIFAGTEQNGVYLSTDDGDTWTTKNNGLTYVGVGGGIGALVVNSSDYVYTEQGEKLFRSINTTVSVKEKNQHIPSEFSLKQNYPNPFNPTTNINYSLPFASEVTIKVYNILGQEVKTIVNEYQNVGRYIINVDFGSFASGVYIYQMRAGEFTQAKKLILMK